jgi:hypothetical protein
LSAPIAVAAALGGALLFGVSSVADQRSAKRVKTGRTLSPAILVDLVRQPLWLIGRLPGRRRPEPGPAAARAGTGLRRLLRDRRWVLKDAIE